MRILPLTVVITLALVCATTRITKSTSATAAFQPSDDSANSLRNKAVGVRSASLALKAGNLAGLLSSSTNATNSPPVAVDDSTPCTGIQDWDR